MESNEQKESFGKIKMYKNGKGKGNGYGFILSEDEEIFFHVSAITTGTDPSELVEGVVVTFRHAQRDGRGIAVDVKVISKEGK